MRKTLYYIFIILTIHSCSNNNSTIQNSTHQNTKNLQSNKTGQVNWVGHWQNEGKREDLIKEIAREFAFENQDIEVNLKFHGEIFKSQDKGAMVDEIVSMIRTNDFRWDVIWLDDNIYQMVADKINDHTWGKKYLVDFSSFEWFGKSQKEFISSDNYYKNLTGGILPGPFLEGYYYTIWFNNDVAEKIGIKITNKGMTADDLLGYAKQTYKYNLENKSEIGFLYECGNWKIMPILFQNLFLSELKQDGSNKNEALIKSLNYFESLAKYKPLIANYNELIWDQTKNYPLDGKCLFYVQGTWMYNHWMSIDANKTNKMYPAELPVFRSSNTYPGGYIPTFAVFKNAANTETGINLLKYVSTPDIAEKWNTYAKNPTGIKGAMSKSTFGLDQFEEYQSYISEKYKQNIRFYPDPSYALGTMSNISKTNFENILLKLLAGKISSKEAYKQLQL